MMSTHPEYAKLDQYVSMSCEIMAWSGDGAVPGDQISGAKGSPNTRSRKSPEAPPPSAVCASFYKICNKIAIRNNKIFFKNVILFFYKVLFQTVKMAVLIFAKKHKICKLVVYALKSTKFENWLLKNDFFDIKITNKSSFSQKDKQTFIRNRDGCFKKEQPYKMVC
jgi:hypothetical protein